jgi:cell division septal protein FtsQ
MKLSKEEKQQEALPAKTDEFIWVLDAANGNVLKVEVPAHRKA